MRRTVFFSALGALLLAALLFVGAQTGGVGAQGQPTPTRNLSDIFVRTPAAEMTPAGSDAVQDDVPVADTLDLTLAWVRLSPGFDEMAYEGVTVGGPVDVFTQHLGEPCAPNIFAAQLPTLEITTSDEIAYIEIKFEADDGSPTALVMWDDQNETWWCSLEAGTVGIISFEPLDAGEYPIFVAVEGSTDTITGTLTLTESMAANDAFPRSTGGLEVE